MGSQLSLLSQIAPTSEVWWTGRPDRSGLAVYTHVIRGPNDPERSPRSARRGQTLRWRGLDDASPEAWADAIVLHLEDGMPRTFNRLMVELFDVPSSVAFETNADRGLWLAVEAERLEYTPSAPVYFRVRRDSSG